MTSSRMVDRRLPKQEQDQPHRVRDYPRAPSGFAAIVLHLVYARIAQPQMWRRQVPRSWSDKDERQYEHIRKSERDMGRGTKRAKAIAAATVNKRRSEEGRTTRSHSRTR